MTLAEALALNGLYVRLLLDLDGESHVSSGRVVGVCVPCSDSPVEAHLLVDGGGFVSPCGGGSEVFLSDVAKLLYSGSLPAVEPSAPMLSLVCIG